MAAHIWLVESRLVTIDGIYLRWTIVGAYRNIKDAADQVERHRIAGRMISRMTKYKK